jgi:hypothetical protein
MKRWASALGLFALLLGAFGCKKQARDNDAVRAGILEHLTSIGTLNMSAMDMDIRSVSVIGNRAHAEVEFRPKNSGTPGAGMHVAYNLEKRDGAWVVLKSQSLGGMIQHPDPGQNPPPTNTDVHSEAMPNFNQILNPSGPPARGTLPPGHPPVTSPQPSSPTGAKDQAPSSKPNS